MKAIIKNTIEHIDLCIESSPLSIVDRIGHLIEVIAHCKFIRDKLGTSFDFMDWTIALEKRNHPPWDLIESFDGWHARGLKDELECIIRTIDSMYEYRRSHQQQAPSATSETPSQPSA